MVHITRHALPYKLVLHHPSSVWVIFYVLHPLGESAAIIHSRQHNLGYPFLMTTGHIRKEDVQQATMTVGNIVPQDIVTPWQQEHGT